MRHFRQLSNEKIREIYVGYLTEEPKLRIARRLEIDNSTVHYHINKIKHLPRLELVALVTPKCSFGHPSFKCLLCGTICDNILSEEFQEIVRLREEVKRLKSTLASRNEVHSSTIHGDNPFTTSAVVGVSG